MIRLIKRQKKFYLRAVIVTGLSCACFSFFVAQIGEVSVEAFTVLAFGGAVFSPDTYPPLLIIGSLPILLFCYFFSDYLTDDLGKTGIYILTRKRIRSQWLLGKMVSLFFITLLFYATTFVLLIFIWGLVGGNLNDIEQWKNASRVLFSCILLNTAATFTIVGAINILSLWLEPFRSFVTVSFVHLLSVFLCLSLSGEPQSVIAHILPSAQGYYAWHEVGVLVGVDAYRLIGGCAVENFSLTYSYTYLGVLSVFEVALGAYAIQRIDLI